MFQYLCPDCGAYLDPGEICDCRDEEKAASSGANTESGRQNTSTVIVDQKEGKVNAEMSLRCQ